MPRQEAPEVSIANGRLRGAWKGGRKGQAATAVFKNVPYAAPPIGDLRWRPPAPVEPWSGVRSATKDGPTAMQQVRAIGNDMQLDPGMGNCGKAGQWVPVGVGQPSLMIGGLTVGGSAS